MAKGLSTPTRVAADVAATAASVAPTESRSVSEQINHWARIGMQVERAGSVANRRVLAVAAGEAQFSTLEPDERPVAHALVDARIAERVAQQRFGADARVAGHATVSMDEEGNLIEIAADGTRRRL
ncbi:MAG TPA: hypothetical protein VMM60_18580 [Ilumatobacter sp.]|nr:hypothetical protein [Ilumatobacter sp.]